MDPIREQKCPACDGTMVFVPEENSMQCEYCGTKMSVEEYTKRKEAEIAAMQQSAAPAPAQTAAAPQAQTAEAAAATGNEQAGKGEKKKDSRNEVEGFDFDSISSQALSDDDTPLPVYHCVSCAAEVIAPREQMALTCPYCGNNIVLTDKASGKLRPDAVIPFAFSSDKLPDAVTRYYKGKKLLPKDFFTESRMGKVTGVYLPFWIFNGHLSGVVTYEGSTSSSRTSGNYTITTTKYYELSREVAMDFKELPVDASRKADDALMDTIEPFDLSKAKPFDMGYLAGFTADRFDMAKNTVANRAQKRMNTSAASVAQAKGTAGYSGVKHTGGHLRANLSAKYMLFPVYLFDIDYMGKKYPFAFNGQTGKVAGKLPIDAAVSRNYFLIRFGIVSGVLFLFSVIKYLLGF